MSDYSVHVDTFAREHLPPKSLWPRLTFSRPELQYPERLNCARVLLDAALEEEGYGQQVVLYSENANWSWSQLRDCTDRIAHVLVRELGIVPGNRVLLRAPNCLLLVATWLAVMKTGAIAVTSMPMLRAKELAAMAEKAHIDHAVCDSRLLAELQQAAAVSAGCATL